MGCICAKKEEEIETAATEYPWANQKSLNPEDYIVQNLKNFNECKLPKSINGQQFLIRNCENSIIYLLDQSDSVLVDDCHYCKIIVGPTKGSVFIRDSKNSVFIVASGQFRISNCYNLTVFLLCPTITTVESATSIRLACYQLNYIGLKGQLRSAGLNIFRNKWTSVFDFTPSTGVPNVIIESSGLDVTDFFPPPHQELYSIRFSFSESTSVTPRSYSINMLDNYAESCLLFLYPCEDQEHIALRFSRSLLSEKNVTLLYTSKTELGLVTTESLRAWAGEPKLFEGDVIALIYGGHNITEPIKNALVNQELKEDDYYLLCNNEHSNSIIRHFVAIDWQN